MDVADISRQVEVGRSHEAVIDRRSIEGIPGVFGEVRVRRGWKVDFELMWRPDDDSGPRWTAEGESLDGAVDLVEQLLGCGLEECDPDQTFASAAKAADPGVVAAAILQGQIAVPKGFELRTWWFATGDYWVRLGSAPPS